MASLSAHRAAGTDHGRLRFHPDCPRCRAERLAGTLAGDALLSRRAQATLAAGLLALSGATPSAAFAVEPDQEQEGTAAPVLGGDDKADDPDIDPGGSDTVLEVETGPTADPDAGGEQDSGDGAPIESEPADDPDARMVLPEHAAPATPAPQPPTSAPPTPEPPLGAPAPAPVTEIERPAPQRSIKREAPKRPRKLTPRTQQPSPRSQPPAQPLSQGAVVQTATPIVQTAPVKTAAASGSGEPAEGRLAGRTYKVRPGDSLWSIARRQLGPEASAGQIAREVSRLWQLNEDRIATGDPDLLPVATVLRLR